MSECFTPCRQLGSYSRRKQVSTYSVLVENKFGLFQVLGDRIYEMGCLFVAVGPNAHFIVLPHWDNMSKGGTWGTSYTTSMGREGYHVKLNI